MFVNEGKGKFDLKYEVLETVGFGGFGVVKKVRDKTTGIIRAMKEL